MSNIPRIVYNASEAINAYLTAFTGHTLGTEDTQYSIKHAADSRDIVVDP